MKKPKIIAFHLASHFAFTIVIIYFFANIFVFLISYFQYTKTIHDAVNARFLVIADDLRETISNGLDLGLSLKELQTTQAVLEKIKKSDSLILSISVFSLDSSFSGKIIYTTQHAGIEGTIPHQWVKEIIASKLDKYWNFYEDDIGTIGVMLVNNFKEPLGGVAVRYDQSQLHRKSSQFAETLFKKILLFSCAGLFILFIFARHILKPICGSFHRMAIALNSFIETHQMPDFKPEHAFEKEFFLMLKNTEHTWLEIKNIEKALEKDEHKDAHVA